MRLYDTFTRSLVELPAAARLRCACTSAARPSTRARTSATRARSSSGCGCARGCARPGYEATLVHNITDINDKIYDAAPGASAELAARATEWYLEDTARPRARHAGSPAEGDRERSRRSSRFIEELIESGHAYAVQGDVYFRVASFPEYGRLSGQRPDQVEEQEPNPLKEDGRDFALWKANKPETEDTWWDSPWGRGRPGWHIECSAMAEEIYGPAFEIHGGGLDLVFPHHENEVAQSRALGHPFAPDLGAQRDAALHRREDVEVDRQRLDDPRGDRRVGPGGGARLLPDGVLAQADRLLAPRRWRRRPPGCETLRNAFTLPAAAHDESALGAPSRQRSTTTSTPRRRSRSCTTGPPSGQLELLRRGLAVFGLESLAERDEAPPEVVELAAPPRRGPRGARLRGVRPAARRAGRARLGRCATAADGFDLDPRVTPELVYGRRAVREALRGRREVLEVWATERAVKSRGLARRGRARSRSSSVS